MPGPTTFEIWEMIFKLRAAAKELSAEGKWAKASVLVEKAVKLEDLASKYGTMRQDQRAKDTLLSSNSSVV
jgi:hypothetical protein